MHELVMKYWLKIPKIKATFISDDISFNINITVSRNPKAFENYMDFKNYKINEDFCKNLSVEFYKEISDVTFNEFFYNNKLFKELINKYIYYVEFYLNRNFELNIFDIHNNKYLTRIEAVKRVENLIRLMKLYTYNGYLTKRDRDEMIFMSTQFGF